MGKCSGSELSEVFSNVVKLIEVVDFISLLDMLFLEIQNSQGVNVLGDNTEKQTQTSRGLESHTISSKH